MPHTLHASCSMRMPYFDHSVDMYEVVEMKGTSHRVLFQNAEGNINMGVMFDDPNVELSDLYWYNVLAKQLINSWIEERGVLVSYNKKRDTFSCYVELHRIGSQN